MRSTQKFAAVGTALALGASGALLAVPAQAHKVSSQQLGQKSLAKVLLKDDSGFDKKGKDFDIVTAAVLAVLDAKPASSVGLLTDGSVKLTAFIPNDDAFAKLVKKVTGDRLTSEKKIFKTVAGLGIDTIEAVLLYHVVPGAPITAKAALKADGAKLVTANGAKLKVNVKKHSVYLVDKDLKSNDAKVVVPNINKGNRQIGHGINNVLLPISFIP